MPIIDSAKVYIFASGDVTTPLATASIGLSSMVTNQAPISLTGPAQNWNTNLTVFWDDTINVGKQCHAQIPPLGPGGLNLAVGTYDLRMVSVVAGVESAKSDAFAVQVIAPPPPILTGVEAK